MAGRGPDEPQLDPARVRTLGGVLVTRLHGVLRGMRLYDPSNRALRGQQQELLDALTQLMHDEASVLGMGEYFYVNGVRLRPESGQLPVFRAVLAELEARTINGLRFSSGLRLEELETFLRTFHAHRQSGANTEIEGECERLGVRNVTLIRARMAAPATTEPETQAPEADQHRVRLVFNRAVSGTRDLLLQTARTGRPALRQARRVVQPIVDRLLRRENSLVGLTALKRHDEYTYAHCVNVSILSLRMGQLLGFSRADLANLGVAALLHDTGKIAVPAEVLRKPGQLNEEEWAAIRRHPAEGLRIISRLPGISGLMLDSMRVAFEHHMAIDHSGYPRVPRPRELGAFSRIVAVADFFDAVTSHRSYRKRPMTAHEALRLLLGRECDHFDRAVLWALVRTVGVYPAGTLMRGDSGRLWLSISPNADDARRPVVRELHVNGSTLEGAPVEADGLLTESETITHVLSPDDVPVDVEALLAA